MDPSEYLPMFLAEAREHLQELNLAVVRLEEEDPEDPREIVNEIFRIAHSMKGMSAAMGFSAMAALTHQMEDVFELLRQRRRGVEREAVDCLLACLDALSASVEAIDTEGVERLEPDALVTRLKGLVYDRRPDQTPEVTTSDADAELLRARAAGRRVLQVSVRLADDVEMPAVRAYMVLTVLAEHGELVGSVPAEDAVESFDGRLIDAWIASDHEEQVVVTALTRVADVASATVLVSSATEAAAPAAPGQAAPEATAAPAKATTSTVRVDAERLDQLMHLMGELVVHRTQVESVVAGTEVPGLQQAIQDLTRSSQALQAMVMQVRMIPVEAVFVRFPRLVRDLSTQLEKKVELVLTGKETELDRTVVDALGDPLVHLVRNSLDHGLETGAERLAAGKPEVGTVEISARHAGGNVVISVRDDGRGIDPARVARTAAKRGLILADAVDSVDMSRAIELLFAAGLSTAEVASDVSGRGVGMDSVRATIRSLGGEVLLQSELGVGTTAQIRLPLTLAIVAALVVETAGLPLALPLDRVERTLRLADHPVRSVAGRRMLVLRDRVLPLLDLAGALGYGECGEADHAVVVRGGEQELALAVSHLVGQRELVTRPLPPAASRGVALSGGAVLTNGQIALVVDADALADALRAGAPVPKAA